MQREFWSDIGRESEGGGTLRRFLPTPCANETGEDETKMRERMKRYGRTGSQVHLKLSTVVASQIGTLTSFAVVSPARTSPTPEEERDSVASDQDYSTKSPVSLAYWDQDTCSWRTWQRCLLEGWEMFSGRWPRSGMTVGGIAYRLPALVPRISGTGSSSSATFPTPTVPLGGGERSGDRAGTGNLHYQARTGQLMFPTPTEHGNYNRKGLTKTSGDGLATRVKQLETQDGIVQRVMFPTPQSRDWKSGSTVSDYGNSRPLSEAVSGQLNPTWVEWLMGFPLGWTDLDASGMP
jgi:hypothetical protein